jgi:hypothetical protein
MEELSPESLSLYNIHRAETTEAYEECFLAHQKEILDSVRASLADTDHRVKCVHDSVDTLHTTKEEEIAGIKIALGSDITTVRGSLSTEISQLAIFVDCTIRFVSSAKAGGITGPRIWPPRDGVASPSGHSGAPNCQVVASVTHTAPPEEGTKIPHNLLSVLNSSSPHSVSDAIASAPRVELLQFKGANPKLWQRRCEEYFLRWNNPTSHWVLYGSLQFTSAATTLLESYITKYPEATWAEFVAAVLIRFMRNQHQVLLRQLYRISQTSTVEYYVHRFSDLIDAILAYEMHPNYLNYLTQFLNGLKPTIRALVAI